MAKRIGGFRRKTRHKLKKHASKKGKISIPQYFKIFKMGERVSLTANTSVQKGMYFPRFHGLSGLIKAKRGKCYEVEINDKGKRKTLIVHPIHLKRL